MRMNSPGVRALTLAVLLSLAALGSGCARRAAPPPPSPGVAANPSSPAPAFPVTLVDSFKRRVTITKAPERIVSLAPGNTEILFALGLGDQVVGVTDHDDYPPEVKTKQGVGGFSDPSSEKILALKPDLVVVVSEHQKVVELLDSLAIPSLALDPKNLEQVYGTITLLGQATGRQAKAQEVIAQMKAKLQEITSVVAKATTKPRVCYEVWADPFMTAGPGTFIGDLITLAGGTNIAADATKSYPQYSLEALVDRNPEIVIYATAHATAEKIKARKGWSNIPAVKNGRIYGIDQNLVSRPGPRLVQGLEEFARVIHPELFKQ